MLEHLPRLPADDHWHFRIEAVSEAPASRREIAAMCRQAPAHALEGPLEQNPRWWEVVRAHARIGPCDGFYFGERGMDDAGIRPEALGSFLTISPSMQWDGIFGRGRPLAASGSRMAAHRGADSLPS